MAFRSRDIVPGYAQAAATGKPTITGADGTPYVFSDSSGDEVDPDTQKPVHMPKKIMSPFMEPGSIVPVTYGESRRVKRAAGTSSYAAALASFRGWK